MLFTFVGCSGVGKNTIIKDLLEKRPLVYDLLPTVTTRAMRPGESQGNPYKFVDTKEEFLGMIESGEIYEHQEIHGDYYGGSWKLLNAKLDENKILLKDIDVLGSNTLKEKFSGVFPVVSLFMYVNDVEILIDRLRKRGEAEDRIAVRRSRFAMEMSLSGTGDYLINNIVREDTARLVDEIIACETGKKTYRLSENCEKPDPEMIEKLTKEAEAGAAIARVEMGFNGKEILILEGADRYFAAKRAGTFIQKHFLCALDETLRANEEIDAEAYLK
ncbi:MAG: hypothetical protein II266_06130 [Clostridia bacterium]|nr:hypothetical protein [Clostridia bacterium]